MNVRLVFFNGNNIALIIIIIHYKSLIALITECSNTPNSHCPRHPIAIFCLCTLSASEIKNMAEWIFANERQYTEWGNEFRVPAYTYMLRAVIILAIKLIWMALECNFRRKKIEVNNKLVNINTICSLSLSVCAMHTVRPCLPSTHVCSRIWWRKRVIAKRGIHLEKHIINYK